MSSPNQTRTVARAQKSSPKPLREKLMFAASAGILAMVAPSGFYGMRAAAQNLPDECVDTDPNDPNAVTNNIAQDGETLECIAPDPATPIDPFYTNAQDLTIQVGGVGADPASTVIGSATLDETALSMTGPGVQTLEIRESGSIINYATGSVNPTVNIDTDGSISLTNRGVIDNQSTLTGGSGEIAVRTKVTQGGGDLVIDSTDGRVLGGVYVYSYGNGKVDLDFGEITSTSGDEGLYVYAGSTVTDLDINVKDITSAGAGIEALSYHSGATNITATGTLTGTDGLRLTQEGSSETTITLERNGAFIGADGYGVHLRSKQTGVGATIKGFVDPNTEERFGTITGTESGVYVRTNGGDVTIQDLDRVYGEGRALSSSYTPASLVVPGAVFTPNSAKLDNQRIKFGADAKVYFSDKVYGHIRYDTTQSDQFSEHKGWAGVTIRF